MKYRNRILVGDCRHTLAKLSDACVHCVVTSPPYYGLRDYGTGKWEGGDAGCAHSAGRGTNVRQTKTNSTKGAEYPASAPHRGGGNTCVKCGAVRVDYQIGIEESPAEYVRQMVEVFRGVRRVLRDDGCMFLNVGDTYASGCATMRKKDGRHKIGDKAPQTDGRFVRLWNGLKNKDLIGIPWMLAFALRDDGWYLRQDIVWHKRNGMTSSVEDRCTTAHEYVFLLTKEPHYYFDIDAIMEPLADGSKERYKHGFGGAKNVHKKDKINRTAIVGDRAEPEMRFPRSVWSLSSNGFKGAHFATMPIRLAERCVAAGTSDRGCCPACGAPWRRVVERERVPTRTGTDSKVNGTAAAVHGNRDPLRHVTKRTLNGWKAGCTCGKRPVPCLVCDPFGGAGTTAVVAQRLHRDYVLCELNPEYAAMARRRIDNADVGLIGL